MEALAQTIKDTVLGNNHNKVNNTNVSRKDVLGLEEQERTRRIEQASQTRIDQKNAKDVSVLIQEQRFPVFKGNVSSGILLLFIVGVSINDVYQRL